MVRWFVKNAIIYTCWSSGTYITVWQKHWSKYLKPFNTDEHEESDNILQWWILERHQSVQWQSLFLLQMPTLSQLQKERKRHDLRFAICLITSEVKHAFCSCVVITYSHLWWKSACFPFMNAKTPTISMTTFLSLKRPAHLNFSSGIVKEEEVKSLPNQ